MYRTGDERDCPELHRELVCDVITSDSHYSLIIDESTDVLCSKCLCLVIRYFSLSGQTIVTAMYALICIEDGKAVTQVKVIEDQLNSDNLPLSK